MSEAIKPKCCGQVSPAGAWRSYPCGKNASMEHEGKHYCKTHHPPTVQAKRDASHAKWQAQCDAQRVREQAARDAAAEQKRRADAYDQLVERVNELEGALIRAQEAINSMKVEAETAAQGDEQMMLEACETISNEGLDADMEIRDTLSKALPNAAAKEAGK